MSDSLEDRIGWKKKLLLELFSGAALFSEIESSVPREAEIAGDVAEERNASCDNPRALKKKLDNYEINFYVFLTRKFGRSSEFMS